MNMRKARGGRRVRRIWKFLPVPGFFEISKKGVGKFDFLQASAGTLKGVLKENIRTDVFFDLEYEGVYYYNYLRAKVHSGMELALEKEAFWEMFKVRNFMTLFPYWTEVFALLLGRSCGVYLSVFPEIVDLRQKGYPRFYPCIRVDFDAAVFLEKRKLFGRKEAFLKSSTFKLELGDNAGIPPPLTFDSKGFVVQSEETKRPLFDETARSIKNSLYGYYNLIRVKDKLVATKFLRYYISLSLFMSLFHTALPRIFGLVELGKVFIPHSLEVYGLLMEDDEYYEFYLLMHFLTRFFARLYQNHLCTSVAEGPAYLGDLRMLEKSGVSLERLLDFVDDVLFQKIGVFYCIREFEGRVYLKVWDCFGKVHIDGLYNF